MAAVVRVKRRRCDDHAEALYLSCVSKRAKTETTLDVNQEQVTSVLRFAGTVPTKGEPVIGRIKNAISRDQLQRDFKQHPLDLRAKLRKDQKTSIQAGRYKVVSTHRELEISGGVQETEKDSAACAPTSEPDSENGKLPRLGDVPEVSKDDGASQESMSGQNCATGGKDSGEVTRESVATNHVSGQARAESSRAEGDLWIYDVEVDSQLGASAENHQNARMETENQTTANSPHELLSNIMCNGVRMTVTPETLSNEEWVYDLYYTTQQLDPRVVVDSLKIEAFPDFYEYRYNHDVGEDAYEDDSDDSNAEDNWRNDYPEEENSEHSGEEDFEGNTVHQRLWQGNGLEAEDADPDFAGMSQMMMDQLFIEGSAYGGGDKKPKPLLNYYAVQDDDSDDLGDNCDYEGNDCDDD